MVNGAAVTMYIAVLITRSAKNKFVNGYEIVNGAAVNSLFVVLTALTICQIVNGISNLTIFILFYTDCMSSI